MKTLWQLVSGYLRHRPLAALLAIGLVALGTGLLSLLLLLDRQLTTQFDRNLAGVDLVIGAKGSPLQLVTSSIYHADSPTGNVPVGGLTAFARPGHPLIAEAVPLALGDSYQGRRIVGTTATFYAWYEAKAAQGQLPKRAFEVAVGARAAERTGLRLGDNFKSVHGLDDNPDLAHADAKSFRVSAVLEPTGLVIDELIVTPLETIWAVHDTHPHEEEEEFEELSPGHDQEASHDHDHEPVAEMSPINGQEWYLQRDRSITALLAKFSARNTATLNFARNLNENTDLMAASPPVVMAQFSEQVAGAEAVIRALGGVILIASVLSLLVILLNALRERTGDLALLRSLGATPGFVFMLVLMEGFMLALLGTLLGLGLGRLLFYLLQVKLSARYPVGDGLYGLHEFEPQLIAISLGAALLAALFPAWRAYRFDPGLMSRFS